MKLKKILTLVAAGFLSLSSATTLASCNDNPTTSSSSSSSSSIDVNTISLLDFHKQTPNAEVAVQGIVSYKLGSKGFFLVDNSTSGVVFCFGSLAAEEVEVGNKVIVSGTVNDYYGAYQLSFPTILSNDNKKTEIDASKYEKSTFEAVRSINRNDHPNAKAYCGEIKLSLNDDTSKYRYKIEDPNNAESVGYIYTDPYGSTIDFLEENAGKTVNCIYSIYGYGSNNEARAVIHKIIK